MKKSDKYFILSAFLFLCFIILIFMVKAVDVSAIGPNGSEIGLSKINGAIFEKLGTSSFWYEFTNKLVLVSFLVVAFFAFIGLMQLIKTKSLKKVDKSIILLGIFYISVLVIYFIFNKLGINYKPVLEPDGTLEASFPSSHVLGGMFIFVTMFMQKVFNRNKTRAERAENIVSATVLSLTIAVGRLLSGVHWFTDILGAVILSLALAFLYFGLCKRPEHK